MYRSEIQSPVVIKLTFPYPTPFIGILTYGSAIIENLLVIRRS